MATKETHSTPLSDEKPTEDVLQQVLNREIRDQDGKPYNLGSLIQACTDKTPRVVVVFIRHFYCSMCQAYIKSLTSDLPPAKLSGLTPATSLIVVGHGDPALIRKYAKETGSAFPIYAEPSRVIYDKLGFVSSLDGALSFKSPEYARDSRLSLAWASIRQYAFGGREMFSSGNVSQNGGELVITDGKIDYFHRMKNTSDHTEIKDLEQVLMA